jgi:hypothetical protein
MDKKLVEIMAALVTSPLWTHQQSSTGEEGRLVVYFL